jgi:SAM-dependent methyltransferase
MIKLKSSEFNIEEFDLAYPVGIENHYWTLCRTRILLNILKKNTLLEKNILEIGCGKGVVVQALRNQDINCTGVELADVEPLKAVKNYVTSNQNAINLDKSFRDSISVVLLLDVIEHIEDAEAFLLSIKNAFINATHFVIMVPARKELWSNYDVFYRHYRRYSLTETTKLGNDIKLDLISHCYFFHSLYLVGLVHLKLFGKRSIQVTAPTGMQKFIHIIISTLFFVEYLLIPGRLLGSSIAVVYKRN